MTVLARWSYSRAAKGGFGRTHSLHDSGRCMRPTEWRLTTGNVYRLAWLAVGALLAILLAGCGGAADARPLAAPAVELHACQLAAPGLTEHLPAKCASLRVF